MTKKYDTHGMYQELSMLLDEGGFEAFLRERSLAKDHSFLLAAISRSNLNPAVRRVAEELIKSGKLKRAAHRPRSDNTDMKNVASALRVLDLEENGWGDKRDATIEEAQL